MIKKFLQTVKSPRMALSVVTLVFLALIVFLSRHELVKAWELLGRANVWLLLLLIPFQAIVYFAGGEMIFSYLRRKKQVRHISRMEQTRIALELNLVNHIFPSGGISGISYTTWRMYKLGVSPAQATFAQLLRFVTGFVSLVLLLIIAVVILALDGQVNRYIVAASFVLVLAIVVLTFSFVIILSSDDRMKKVASGLGQFVNGLVRRLTFGRVGRVLERDRVLIFFSDIHVNFQEMAVDKRSLVRPLAWGAVYAIFDIAMFMVAFWALGASVNPAILLVGYGVAGLAGFVAFTPGGAGVYELIMIFFLTMAGVSADLAIAGIVLTRAILLTGTIIFGYAFYQHALWKYGGGTDDGDYSDI